MLEEKFISIVFQTFIIAYLKISILMHNDAVKSYYLFFYEQWVFVLKILNFV